jgi:hypothetical protein
MAMDSVHQSGDRAAGLPRQRVHRHRGGLSDSEHGSVPRRRLRADQSVRPDMSDAATDYAFDPLEEFNTIDQTFSPARVGRPLEGLGCGRRCSGVRASSIAIERDRQPHEQDAAAGLSRDDMSLTFGNDFGGTTKVDRSVFEVELPLLAAQAGARIAEPEHCARRTHYDNTETRYSNGAVNGQHDVTSWKVSTTWDPLDWFRMPREPVARHPRCGLPRALLSAEHSEGCSQTAASQSVYRFGE